MLYKPIFMSYESSHQPLLPINQRGYKQKPHVIMDQTVTIVILKDVKEYTDHMWFLGSSSLVIINQDKNITQRMQPTEVFNLLKLLSYRWFLL